MFQMLSVPWKISSATELSNVLVKVKSWCDEETPMTSMDILLEIAINNIQKVLDIESKLENHELLRFIIEQLKQF